MKSRRGASTFPKPHPLRAIFGPRGRPRDVWQTPAPHPCSTVLSRERENRRRGAGEGPGRDFVARARGLETRTRLAAGAARWSPDLGRKDRDRTREEALANPARPGAKPVVKPARVAGRSGHRGETKNETRAKPVVTPTTDAGRLERRGETQPNAEVRPPYSSCGIRSYGERKYCCGEYERKHETRRV
jgi:hypothetical protein